MERDSVSKGTMINLQAQGYKITDSNILQSTTNEVGRCTSCGGQRLQIREHVWSPGAQWATGHNGPFSISWVISSD